MILYWEKVEGYPYIVLLTEDDVKCIVDVYEDHGSDDVHLWLDEEDDVPKLTLVKT